MRTFAVLPGWIVLLNDLGVGVAGSEVAKEGEAERSLQHQHFAAPILEEQVDEEKEDTQYCIKCLA